MFDLIVPDPLNAAADRIPHAYAYSRLRMLQESPEEAFEEWVAAHEKVYATEGERAHRAAVWRDNLAYIEAYNAQETTHWVRPPPSVSLSPHAVAATQLQGPHQRARSVRSSGHEGSTPDLTQ